jgi:hypothetical protein
MLYYGLIYSSIVKGDKSMDEHSKGAQEIGSLYRTVGFFLILGSALAAFLIGAWALIPVSVGILLYTTGWTIDSGGSEIIAGIWASLTVLTAVGAVVSLFFGWVWVVAPIAAFCGFNWWATTPNYNRN